MPKPIRVAINGFGRIGRLTLRAAVESSRDDVEFVAINCLAEPNVPAHLLKFDSTHGRLSDDVSVDGDDLVVGKHRVRLVAQQDPSDIGWGDLGVDVVLECTGRFNTRDAAAKHLESGAKRVLVSAPASGADLTVVYGINHTAITAQHTVVSNASCTTNCLAPVAKVLDDNIGIARGYMTTVHAYTGDQMVLDGVRADFYRARAAASNLIPTSTGATKAVGLVLPNLQGRLRGSAIRVPTMNVSLVDLTFDAGRRTSVDEVNDLMRAASEHGPLADVLDVNDMPLVSSDFNHCAASAVFDIGATVVIDGEFVRVVAWYDNEWGYSNRMLDTAVAIGQTI